MSVSDISDISDMREERERLVARVGEIDRIIQEKEEEIRSTRIESLLAHPIDNEDYMYVLKNYSMFYKLLKSQLGGISYELNRNCANAIVDHMIYKYKKPRTSFIDWLNTVIFNIIYDFSRKEDAEEYLFSHAHKIENFIENKFEWDEMSPQERIMCQKMNGFYCYE